MFLLNLLFVFSFSILPAKADTVLNAQELSNISDALASVLPGVLEVQSRALNSSIHQRKSLTNKSSQDLSGYWKKVFSDEFQGPPIGISRKQKAECFDSAPVCDDMYNEGVIPCSESSSQSFPYLKALNKCVWRVHRSLNWMSPQVNEFDPREVEVHPEIDNGVILLKGHSVKSDGSLLSYGEQNSNADFDDMDSYRGWMTENGYHCENDNHHATRHCPLRTGLVTSRGVAGFQQQFGLIQVRGKLSHGPGAWPAIWMLPNAPWPGGGEFDLMESWNKDQASQTIHTGVCVKNGVEYESHPGWGLEDLDPNACVAAGGTRIHIGHGETLKGKDTPTGRSMFSNYHSYSLEWDANQFQFRTDGVATNHIDEGTEFGKGDQDPKGPGPLAVHVPKRPFYMLLNQTIGGNGNGPDPTRFNEQSLAIDYVRSWQKCEASDYCPNGGIFSAGVCSQNGISYPSPCTKCLYGGSEGDSNCNVHGFSRPELTPGLTYWVDTDIRYPGIYYKQIDGTCPVGGTISGNGNCQFKALETAANQIPTPGVNFWVDPDSRWAGVFYKQVNGRCPFGGVISGSGNCVWKYFSNLNAGVHYWVDTDPRYPGIFYKQVSGQCKYGGWVSGNGNCQWNSFNFTSGSTTALVPGTNYWVDTNPLFPGIYYKNILGACRYGGTVSGNGNCQLKSFSKPSSPYLAHGVEYWADADIRWPGVYYNQIKGACPYGGTLSGNGHCQLVPFTSGMLEDHLNYWVDTNPRWPGVYYRQTY